MTVKRYHIPKRKMTRDCVKSDQSTANDRLPLSQLFLVLYFMHSGSTGDVYTAQIRLFVRNEHTC